MDLKKGLLSIASLILVSSTYATAIENDYNGDGIADIFWRTGSTNHVWNMKTDGTHTYKNIGGKSSTYSVAGTGDFNNDDIADILWKKGNRYYLWYMKADGTHGYKSIGSKSYTVEGIGDFNADGMADILWRKGSNLHVWLMKSSGAHDYINLGKKSTTYRIVGEGDFNGDGITDIFWKKGEQNYLWYMNADGTHAYKKISSKSYRVMAIGDYNGDGIADIFWRKGSKNHVWIMAADGTHTYVNIGNKSSTYTVADSQDYNADGITDVFWKRGNANYLWYMNADGTHAYKYIGKKSSKYYVMRANGENLANLVVGKTVYFLNAKGFTGNRTYHTDGTYTGSGNGTYTIEGNVITLTTIPDEGETTFTLTYVSTVGKVLNYDISVNGGATFQTSVYETEAERDAANPFPSKFTTTYLDGGTFYNISQLCTIYGDNGKCTEIDPQWGIYVFTFTKESFSGYSLDNPDDKFEDIEYSISGEGYLTFFAPWAEGNREYVKIIESRSDYMRLDWSPDKDNVHSSRYTDYFYFDKAKAETFRDSR